MSKSISTLKRYMLKIERLEKFAFQRGKKQGAVEELEDFKHIIWIPDITVKDIREHLDKRLRELGKDDGKV